MIKLFDEYRGLLGIAIMIAMWACINYGLVLSGLIVYLCLIVYTIRYMFFYRWL
jgi:hypothetical protein